MGNNPFESDEPVRFNLGDTGIEVSNDPRAQEEDYMEKALEKLENTGRATRSTDEVNAELGTGQPPGTVTGADLQADENLEKSVDEMTVDELKAYVEELRAQGVEVDTEGVRTKSQLRQAIKDAEAGAAEAQE